MKEQEKRRTNQKPRMNQDLLAEYNRVSDLWEQSQNGDGTSDQALLDEVNRFQNDYDWMSYMFTDENGKIGMKDITGAIIVPARYDDFLCTFHYEYKMPAIPALKNGKYGLVKTDGSGTEITDFVYDDMENVEWAYSFYFKKNGSEKFGILLPDGTEALPCCLDAYCERFSDAIILRGEGKEGVFLPNQNVIIAPKYDSVEFPDEPEDPMIFTLDKEVGYVDFNGNFISKFEYNSLENSDNPDDNAKFEEWSANLICAQQEDH